MMFEEYEKKKRKQIAHDEVADGLWHGPDYFVLGSFFLLRDQLVDISFNERLVRPMNIDKIFGVICVLYGAWRIYRGYKKNYFR